MHKFVKIKPKEQWTPQEVNRCQECGTPAEGSWRKRSISPREKPCRLKPERV
jgi:ribosomal protein S14